MIKGRLNLKKVIKKGKKKDGEDDDGTADGENRLPGDGKKGRKDRKAAAADPALRPSYKVYDKTKGEMVDAEEGDERLLDHEHDIIPEGVDVDDADDAKSSDGMPNVAAAAMKKDTNDDEDDAPPKKPAFKKAELPEDEVVGPGGVTISAMKASHILSSAGTQRLNRILHNSSIPTDAATAAARNFLGAQEQPVRRAERVSNPHNLQAVSKFVERIVVPPLKVDSRSIGGEFEMYPEHSMMQESLLCYKIHGFETSGSTETVQLAALQRPAEYAKHKREIGFFGMGAGKTNRNKLRYVMICRSTNRPLFEETKEAKLLHDQQRLEQEQQQGKDSDDADKTAGDPSESDNIGYDTMFAPDTAAPAAPNTLGGRRDSAGVRPIAKEDDTDMTNSAHGPDETADVDEPGALPRQRSNPSLMGGEHEHTDVGGGKTEETEMEVSGFPVLVCMTLYSDGTNPDVRKLIPLSQLTSIQDMQTAVVQLGFINGDTVRLDFGDDKGKKKKSKDKGKKDTMDASGRDDMDKWMDPEHQGDGVIDDMKAVEGSMTKEQFIWSLLQIHAMLCVSVVEAYSLQQENKDDDTMAAHTRGDRTAAFLPPLNVRNIDKGELQYVATVNGFLRESPTICKLLDRQRALAEDLRKDRPQSQTLMLLQQGNDGAGDDEEKENAAVGGGENNAVGGGESKTPEQEAMDKLAYDLLMGNFATRVAIFHSEAERKDAEEILNSTEWTSSLNSEDTAAATAAERLSMVLQRRMRDLEAETCRRLIAWEDEKHYSVSSSSLSSKTANRDSVDALSLASLFNTLDGLDKELQNMEHWLGERAAAIKPMTDDCRDIEEENRQLEQQWKSYDMLGSEMRRLLKGLEIRDELDRVLKNPASALVYDDQNGRIDVQESQDGVDQIHEAGKALQYAMQHVQKSGGLHLKAVIERSSALEKTANSFCTALAQIIVTVMEQFKNDVVAGSDYGKVSKSDTHTVIAKKIRDTQRKFQSSLLGYIKLIEILAELSPELIPAVRDAYSEMVAEGIMMKKRMKGYFQALPGKNSAYLKNVSRDMKEYQPKLGDAPKEQEEEEREGKPKLEDDTVHASDIRFALSELLPVIAREAYFTAALFGLSNKAQDGRDKKRNFEAAKKSVDHSSQYFNYYIQRTCGIVQEFEVENPKGDPMLCLVSSIHLNEAMENYIDREKKGGDHSLSLAYVRATILDLRKKVDKQWVAWVERQIEWIRSHPGVPANGKRAGIIPSFSRFPCYLDHILVCCREGRSENYTPDLANIKVVSYYLQKIATALLESLRECAERESTEKQYADNVMQMENTYYFSQCIKQRGPEMAVLFRKPIAKANATCKASTDAYLGWMIKREFAVLHDLFSRISKLRREAGDREVVSTVPKGNFVNTLMKNASREVMKDKIGVMYARMGKHLSEEGGLLPVAWKALVKVLYEWFGRWEKLSSQCYQHKLDPSAVDIVRIAKAAGGTGGNLSAVDKSASSKNKSMVSTK